MTAKRVLRSELLTNIFNLSETYHFKMLYIVLLSKKRGMQRILTDLGRTGGILSSNDNSTIARDMDVTRDPCRIQHEFSYTPSMISSTNSVIFSFYEDIFPFLIRSLLTFKRYGLVRKHDSLSNHIAQPDHL
jgi:hypothetical protein